METGDYHVREGVGPVGAGSVRRGGTSSRRRVSEAMRCQVGAVSVPGGGCEAGAEFVKEGAVQAPVL